MEENMNFELEQQPVTEQPIALPKCGKPITLIAVAIALCIALLFGIVFAVVFAKSPTEKTAEAVFPSLELFEELMTEGGTLTVDGELANDLLDGTLKEPLCFSAQYAFAEDGSLLSLNAGAQNDRVDLNLLTDMEGMQMYSERLLGEKVYGIAFEGLMDAIDASPFAPESGTAYELPRDVYDMINQYAELLEEEPQNLEETTLVITKATDAMLKKAIVSKKRETVSLVDGDTKAKVCSYTFESDAFDAFVAVLNDAWKNNEAFRGEIESFDTDGKIASFVQKMLKELEVRKDTIPQMESPFKNVSLTYKYAVKGGYLVYAETQLTPNKASDDAKTISLAIKFTKKPKKDPSYNVELSTVQRGESNLHYVFSYHKSDDGKKGEWIFYDPTLGPHYTATAEYGKDDAFALTVKYEIDTDVADGLDLVKMWQFDLNGTLRKTDDSFALGIDEMEYKDKDGKTQFHMSDSSFGICLESGEPSIKRRENETNLLGMSVAELNELGATLEGELIKALDGIGDKLGVQLVHDTYMPNALATVMAEGNLTDYAYDRSNGRLFLAYSRGTSGEIRMYNASTMELLDKLELEDPVLAIDADGGYLVFAYDKSGQQTAYVHSSADMTYIKEFDFMDHNSYYVDMEYPGDILVDGDRLIYVSGDQHVTLYFADIKTGKTVRSPNGFYEGKLSIDRENHIVAALENSLSTCNLLFFSTVDCELIEQIDRFGLSGQYLKSSAHFDGSVFWATADEWYTPDERFGSLASALDFDTHGTLAMVVYRDKNLIATLETDASGAAYTAFYRADGTYCDKTDELYLWMQPTDGNHYLVAYTDGNKTVFAYCELVDGKTIG